MIYPILGFMCGFLQIVVLSFFVFAIALSVPLRFVDSDYPFRIFKLFLRDT